ncbi:zinc-binding dehydrogenase [Flavobacterium poyangense]|uniref:zinc-binding dehydrogenase n=1 Tax=Flavobacterium poyangense TaxID=2204302 RepID=UPI0014235437|nr:zinc-binding dehydrogenase [Flavobacterium sp. JXAS1]
MIDVNEFIANLSPEQVAEFMQKLRTGKTDSTTAISGIEIKKPVELKTKPYAPKPGDNFIMHMQKPGNLSSFIFKKKEILPPAPDQVQICVKATSLNFRDLMIAMKLYHSTPGVASVMGSDFSGVVTAVGSKITEFKIGDEVFCLSAGSLTQNGELDEDSHFVRYTNIKSDQVTKKPGNISWQQAACIPTAFLTSYFVLMHNARLEKRHRVLIHTATGGVGQSAIQIAKWIGAEAFVTAGTDLKREYLESIGFKDPMNSRTMDFIDQILERTNQEGVDVILNTLGGEAASESLKILKNFGHFLQVDKKDIAANYHLPLAEFKKGISYSAFDLGLFYLYPDMTKKYLDLISAHFERGDFEPIQFETYAIKDLGKALSYMSRSQHIGKIVLEYDQE